MNMPIFKLGSFELDINDDEMSVETKQTNPPDFPLLRKGKIWGTNPCNERKHPFKEHQLEVDLGYLCFC